MSDEPAYEFTAPLTVCVDFKSPHAYLAKDPTYSLADELGVDVDWLPLVVAPLTPPRPAAESDGRGARHRRFRALYLERDLMRYAKIRGLALRNLYRAPDTSLAALGLLWVKEYSPDALRPYMDLVFARYWCDELEIENPAVLSDLLDEIGAESGGFADHASGAGRAEQQSLQASLAAAGVFSAPSYVVKGEIFLGRQHLPMISWLLTGKSAPPPI